MAAARLARYPGARHLAGLARFPFIQHGAGLPLAGHHVSGFPLPELPAVARQADLAAVLAQA